MNAIDNVVIGASGSFQGTFLNLIDEYISRSVLLLDARQFESMFFRQKLMVEVRNDEHDTANVTCRRQYKPCGGDRGASDHAPLL